MRVARGEDEGAGNKVRSPGKIQRVKGFGVEVRFRGQEPGDQTRETG